MAEPKASPPTADELDAKRGGLKSAETREGAAWDEAPYKAAWEAAGGDPAKVKEAVNLTETPTDYDSYIQLCKAGKFH
eukprot:NODE_7723_length_424_cov_222.135501.p2 GENE.NODE_7723_length_424_cov_222.135501~~NODE_7723_length_424_cov_222.135501.p2  ORF type:complete len:78 (+),score=21.96 NODE_7723_length_424_cov_222.135501:21-254(+)